MDELLHKAGGKRRLLIATSRATQDQLKRLSRFAVTSQLSSIPESELDDTLRSVECLLLHGWPSVITNERVQGMKNLKFIQTALAGVNHIPFQVLSKNVIVCSNAGAYSSEVGEYAWGLALAASKKIVSFDSSLKSGTWRDKPAPEIGRQVTLLAGKVLGIIGYGQIGHFVARVGKSFGMRIYAFSRKSVSERNVVGLRGKRGLAKLLSRSDVVICALPLTKLTRDLIGKEQLSAMKKDAILVNVGRAEVVRQDALYEHLKENPSFTYATDVWWMRDGKEIFNPGLPFLSLPNFIGTPHASGPSAAVTGRPMELAVRNTLRFLRGLEPRNIVGRSEYLQS